MPFKDKEVQWSYDEKYQREYFQKKKEQIRERNRRYRERHPERVKQQDLEKCRRYKAKHREKIRIRNRERARTPEEKAKQRVRMLKYKFGLTPQQYDALLAKQGGLCAICKQPETQQHTRSPDPTLHTFNVSLAVDHCHATGRVRGLLCNGCNRGVAVFRDNPTLMIAAAGYITTTTDKL